MGAIAIDSVGAVTDEVVEQLSAVLLDAVRSGASVSFMSELDADQATAWWRKTLTASSKARGAGRQGRRGDRRHRAAPAVVGAQSAAPGRRGEVDRAPARHAGAGWRAR